MRHLLNFPQIIKTPRLVLRVLAPTKENAQQIFNAIAQNREFLTRWLEHFVSIQSTDDVIAYLTKRQEQLKDNKGVCFHIFCNDDVIGRIWLFRVKDNTCEIGYWLIESVNGHGYMTEALLALEGELFKFGFDKIMLELGSGNTRSENLAIRNGYKLEKRLPMASMAKCVGKCDSLIYVKER